MATFGVDVGFSKFEYFLNTTFDVRSHLIKFLLNLTFCKYSGIIVLNEKTVADMQKFSVEAVFWNLKENIT